MTARRFLSTVHRLAAKALASGGTLVNASRIRWDIAGNCERSYVTEYYARPSRRKNGFPQIVVGPGTPAPMTVEIHTRCRECEPCKTARRRLWSYRAEAETRLWPRTWFGTLTLRPDDHYRMLARARAKLDRQGVDYDTLSAEEQFRLLDQQIWSELNKMFKRIRSAHKGALRYFIVAEAHASGLPHYHALIHQCDELPLRYTTIAKQWPHGFVKWRLVKSVQEVRYVAKYLSKSAVARVRASQAYGTPEGVASETQRESILPEKEGGI